MYAQTKTKFPTHFKYKHWIFVMAAVLLISLMLIRSVRADDLQPLIDAVTKQIQENQANANQKQAEADTLANHLAAVQSDLAASRSNLELTRQNQANPAS